MSSANFRKNSIYALVAKASGAAAALLTTMLLTRTLSEADFGGYVLAYTVVVLGSILGPLGMGNAVLRFAGACLGTGDYNTARQVTRKCIVFGTCGLLVLSTLALICQPIATSTFESWPTGIVNAMLIAIWVWGTGMVLLLTSAMRAFGKIGSGALAEITLPRLALLATIGTLYVLKVDSLTVMLAAASAVSLLAAAWALFCLIRAIPNEANQNEPSAAIGNRRVFDFAIPLLGSNVLFQLMTDSTLFFVAYYCNAEQVALYGAAYRIWGFLGLPQNAVASAIQGRIAELHAANNRDGLEEIVRSSASLATLPTFLITIVICLAAGPLLGLLFGEFYAGGHSALVLLCIAQLAFVALGPCEHLLAMSGNQRTVLVMTMVSALLAIGFAWLLTPQWGMLGAAIAAAIATVSFKILLAWQAYKQMGIRSWLTLSAWGNPGSPTLATATAPRKPRQ